MIPSPAKHKQTKTTQQQIQSHLKKVDVSRSPVVSNEATQELKSVAVNKHNYVQSSVGRKEELVHNREPQAYLFFVLVEFCGYLNENTMSKYGITNYYYFEVVSQ